MPRSWRRDFTAPSRSEVDSLVVATLESLPHVAGRNDEVVQTDYLETWRSYAYLYYDTLASLSMPTDEEVAQFEKVARRRLHQSVELVDFHHAFRTGARILLEDALARVDPADAAMVASLTLEFEDTLATAAERAFLEEQRSVALTESDYTVRLLLRLLRGELLADDAQVALAPIQGYDFTRTFTVVSIGPPGSAVLRRLTDDESMPRVSGSLRSVLPFALQLPYNDSTLFLLVPGDAVASLSKLLQRVLANSSDPGIKVGISTPTAGVGGVVPGAEEATRARVIGEILEPSQTVHSWDHVQLVDVFREADVVTSYVQQQLGPLLENDERKGTQLVETLAAFLEANGNRKLAARNLTVHINTLDYRLRQIRNMLGEDWMTEGSFTAHLAVRLFPLYLLAKARQSES